MNTSAVRILVGGKAGTVSGLLTEAERAKALLVMAHGAGAGMRHRFMEQAAARLSEHGVTTLRYQFPYMEKGSKRPDAESVLTDTVRAAVAAGAKQAGNLPLFAGGKSMGGRMTSLAAAKQGLSPVRGLVFFGFPLHAAGKPGAERGAHLNAIQLPMSFLQGSRDALADLRLFKPLWRKLAGRADHFIVEGGDHSFHMLKSAARTDDEVLSDVAAHAAQWMLRNR